MCGSSALACSAPARADILIDKLAKPLGAVTEIESGLWAVQFSVASADAAQLDAIELQLASLVGSPRPGVYGLSSAH